MNSFIKTLGDTEMIKEIASLWHEYEDAKTSEALFVKDLDKFEMIVQAVEYEKCMYMKMNALLKRINLFFLFKADKKKLQGFFDSTKGKFQHPVVKAWAEELYKEREEILKTIE